MNISNNFFNKYVENIQSDAETFSQINQTFKICQRIEDVKEKVNYLKETLLAIPNRVSEEKISKDLAAIRWTVETLDPVADEEVSTAAFLALHSFAKNLGELSGYCSLMEKEGELKDLAKSDKTFIHNLYKNVDLEEAISLADQMELKGLFFLPKEEELEEEGKVDPSASDLTLRSNSGKASEEPTYLQSFLSHLIFSPGAYYNPVPLSVKSYYLESDIDNQASKQNILSLMKGEKVETELQPLSSKERVKAPNQFCKDIGRIDGFSINGKSYSVEEEKEIIGIDLYRLLGKKGGERMMQVCNQALLAYYTGKLISRCSSPDGEGEWQKKFFPEKFLLPKNGSGINFNIQVDEKEQTIKVAAKILMTFNSFNLGAIEPETDEKKQPYLIVKSEFELPISELVREDFDELEDPVPHMKVTDLMSSFIINNKPLAEELFEKF